MSVPSDDLVEFTAAAGAEIDRVFRAAMRAAAAFGGPTLRDRHGAEFGEILIEFRTVLASPDGLITPDGLAEVNRYGDPAAVAESVRRCIGRGTISKDPAGVLRATGVGHAFLRDVYALQATALAEFWASREAVIERLAVVTASLVVAATSRPVLARGALTALTPNHEPAGMPASVLLLNRLSALRYHRSDAHALAWRAAGLTAAEMVRLADSSTSAAAPVPASAGVSSASAAAPVPTSAGVSSASASAGVSSASASVVVGAFAIEAETNVAASPPFAILDQARRARFLDDLRSLP